MQLRSGTIIKRKCVVHGPYGPSGCAGCRNNTPLKGKKSTLFLYEVMWPDRINPMTYTRPFILAKNQQIANLAGRSLPGYENAVLVKQDEIIGIVLSESGPLFITCVIGSQRYWFRCERYNQCSLYAQRLALETGSLVRNVTLLNVRVPWISGNLMIL